MMLPTEATNVVGAPVGPTSANAACVLLEMMRSCGEEQLQRSPRLSSCCSAFPPAAAAQQRAWLRQELSYLFGDRG